MFLTPSDFTGKYELHTGMYVTQKITDYISRYEKRYLIDLLGKKLYNELMDDINTATNAPQSPNLLLIFNPFEEDVNFTTNHFFNTLQTETIVSEGILDMLKGFIYFEYSKDILNQQTIYGNVQQKAENSKIVNTLQTLIYSRFNEAITSYQNIQKFIFLHRNEPLGQALQTNVLFVGLTYYNSQDVTPTPLSGVSTQISIGAIGTGYVANNNVTTSGGNGTGLTIDYTDDGTGGINTITVINPGSGYLVGDVLTVNDGNNDATLIIDNATQIIIGTGLTIDLTAFPIGGVETFTLVTPGTNYTTAQNLTTTTTGAGIGCTVSVEVDNAGVITNLSIYELGYGYVIGDTVTIVGGNNDATFNVDSVTNGEIQSIIIKTAGVNYNIGDTFLIPGGNGAGQFQLIYVGIGNLDEANGKQRNYNYWL